MKKLLNNINRFFPVQLFFLHLRKSQVLLLIWVMLFSVVGSSFMQTFGTDALFFVPEYLGSTNILSAVITGFALGVFIMSWHITTFVLHSKRFRFLATTTHPFLKYCVNNFIIPLAFIIFYFIRLYKNNTEKELMQAGEIFILLAGICIGIVLSTFIAFAYFFGAGKTIHRRIAPIIEDREQFKTKFSGLRLRHDEFGLKVNSYLDEVLRLHLVRNVGHYRQDYLALVFQRHHLAAMFAFILAFLFLILVGFNLDRQFFEMPAAASILVFFGVLIALIGAVVYILSSWSLLAAVFIILFINTLLRHDLIDFSNKAYGLSYPSRSDRTPYSEAVLSDLSHPRKIDADKQQMISILNKWKARQAGEKPVIVFLSVSGGGLRSATFVMNTLQRLDSLSNGKLMHQTFLIAGASGGMLAANYYRELYRKKVNGDSLVLSSNSYLEDISGDLLNPVFTSIMARDILTPVQRFNLGDQQYIKDRGYAFENKLNFHTGGILNTQLRDIVSDESAGRIPLVFYNAVIKNDGRKLLISTQPVSFMMKPVFHQQDSLSDADAVDFGALFRNNDPLNLRTLTALRMNATFPYVLPSVWLPSQPVIDVMDAGLRDNSGEETTFRFIENFSGWLKENTAQIVVIQIRDRQEIIWNNEESGKSLTNNLLTPGTTLARNWMKMQHYYQVDQLSYLTAALGGQLNHFLISYIPRHQDRTAALNFHLTRREKLDVINAFNHKANQQQVNEILRLIK